MGLISLLRRASNGQTESQTARRYERARSRNSEYQAVVQWFAENDDNGNPGIAQNYDDLTARFTFRPAHRAGLLRQRSEIGRKLRHAQDMGIQSNPWLSVFTRPDDHTVYCFWAILRDSSQNYAMLSPFWFLSSGETEAQYHAAVMEAL